MLQSILKPNFIKKKKKSYNLGILELYYSFVLIFFFNYQLYISYSFVLIVEALKGLVITKEPRKRIKYRNIPTNNKIKSEKTFMFFEWNLKCIFMLESLFALPYLCVFFSKKQKNQRNTLNVVIFNTCFIYICVQIQVVTCLNNHIL